MKRFSILFIIGLLLVACSQKDQIETSVPVDKNNQEAKMGHLNLKEASEIAIFSTAVNDSTIVPGIANMENPQYKFKLEKELYFLWIADDNGTIMNAEDTHTVHSLSDNSFQEVKEFINTNLQ